MYIEQPYGFTDSIKCIYRLNQALYRLRKSPLQQFETISAVLKEYSFILIILEIYLFKNNKISSLLLLYINDIQVVVFNIDSITKTR